MKNNYAEFYDDALAYLTDCIKSKCDPEEILSTLLHDISVVVRQEKCFLPRVSGWALDGTGSLRLLEDETWIDRKGECK